MKKIFFLIASLVIFSCQTQSQTTGTMTTVDTKTFEKGIANTEVQILDVRTPDEYEGGYIKGAKNLDVNEDNTFDEGLKKLDKTKPIYVYCLSGGRSKTACKKLISAGFTTVYNLDGGVMKWKADAKTLVINNPAEAAKNKGMSLEDFKAKLKSDKPTLVEFYAPWCGPCKILKPQVEKLAADNKDKINVLYIDVDQNTELADALKIQSIPVLKYYNKKGKQKWNITGAPGEDTLYKKLGFKKI
jgi:thioredoxin 1